MKSAEKSKMRHNHRNHWNGMRNNEKKERKWEFDRTKCRTTNDIETYKHFNTECLDSGIEWMKLFFCCVCNRLLSWFGRLFNRTLKPTEPNTIEFIQKCRANRNINAHTMRNRTTQKKNTHTNIKISIEFANVSFL